ncbi:methylthioribulose 1-phosphate dehydratase [Methyloparacoccus murrellii]
MSDDFPPRAQELIEAGRFIDRRGWVPATSGNFSARLADGRIAITVSGRHKGRLVADDIMLVDADGNSLDDRRPSAETRLHTALYRRYPGTGCVLHPHSPGATLVSRLWPDELILENYELLKALGDIRTHATRVRIPIFPNDQDIDRLAARVDDWLDQHGDTHGYIIASHGFYTWGATVAAALRQVEALEFLFDIESRLHGVKTP